MLVGAIFAFIGVFSWNSVELQVDAVAIVVLGTLSYVGGGFLARLFLKRRRERQEKESDVSRSAGSTVSADAKRRLLTAAMPFHIKTWKLIVFLVILLIAAVIRICETTRLGLDSGIQFSNYMELAQWVRWTYAPLFSEESVHFGVGYSFIARQMLKVLFVGGYLSSIYLGFSFRKKDYRKETGFFVACFVLCCLTTFLEGERATIFGYFVAILVASFIGDIRSGKSAAQLSISYGRVIVIAAVVGIAVFYVLGLLIGRVGSSGPVEYVTFYFGCGIPSLQIALDSGLNLSAYPGSQTFAGIFDMLYKLYILPTPDSGLFQFVTLGSHVSNIFTQYFRYFSDFGYVGVIVFPLLSNIVLTLCYTCTVKTRISCLVLLYPTICGYVVDQVRDAFVFNVLLSVSWLVSFALLALAVFLLHDQGTQWIARQAKNIAGAFSKNKGTSALK